MLLFASFLFVGFLFISKKKLQRRVIHSERRSVRKVQAPKISAHSQNTSGWNILHGAGQSHTRETWGPCWEAGICPICSKEALSSLLRSTAWSDWYFKEVTRATLQRTDQWFSWRHRDQPGEGSLWSTEQGLNEDRSGGKTHPLGQLAGYTCRKIMVD